MRSEGALGSYRVSQSQLFISALVSLFSHSSFVLLLSTHSRNGSRSYSSSSSSSPPVTGGEGIIFPLLGVPFTPPSASHTHAHMRRRTRSNSRKIRDHHPSKLAVTHGCYCSGACAGLSQPHRVRGALTTDKVQHIRLGGDNAP
eukprot:COSAG05_NODE_899_length_6679_cov_4.328419_9_plen_144_part_00